MLEKPNLQDEVIVNCLQNAYSLCVVQIAFLPLGADLHTAIYRVVTQDGWNYFVKLRSSDFNEISVELPKFLSDQGIKNVITPLVTNAGQLWANMDPFKLILYPFINGQDGYQIGLTQRNWRDFGIALKSIHTLLFQLR